MYVTISCMDGLGMSPLSHKARPAKTATKAVWLRLRGSFCPGAGRKKGLQKHPEREGQKYPGANDQTWTLNIPQPTRNVFTIYWDLFSIGFHPKVNGFNQHWMLALLLFLSWCAHKWKICKPSVPSMTQWQDWVVQQMQKLRERLTCSLYTRRFLLDSKSPFPPIIPRETPLKL